MKTLVIHPKDETTDFLKLAYLGKEWTIINHNIKAVDLKEAIKSHDRIIMMGHGTENGLIGFGRFIINNSYEYLLKQKECVFIWCKADEFVRHYRLKGFATGMIISDFEEAFLYCVKATNNEIEISNLLFADSLKRTIYSNNMLKEMKWIYSSNENPIIMFNQENLHYVV